ncbi:type VI secretion system contractile sheath large subunit [Thaumasiovibrio subtropicus]|uniref:type VI secretion system contractile sheath large subunit n=1 Tax=Thaumasiovibrio subtropicus TaxID=1891207 RepID=UPI000B3594B4|nr:type VI secretion system contractile sheath large subunit [Thaumasiovibrio subtropicus]
MRPEFISVELLEAESEITQSVDLNAIWMDRFIDIDDPIFAIRYWLDFQQLNFDSIDALQRHFGEVIGLLDEVINEQLNEIIHHKAFQQLEASWRGLKYTVREVAELRGEDQVKVKVLNYPWHWLVKDCNKAIEFDQSELFRLIYQNEYSMPGGEPFGVLIGDYRIQHGDKRRVHQDVDVLRKVTQTAAAAFCPFITSADPTLLGVDEFADLATVADISAQFRQPEYISWTSLRSMEDSRFLAITLPDVLMREVYRPDGSRAEDFAFIEHCRVAKRDMLWGSAAYSFALVVARAFIESGWFGQIRGHQRGQYKKGIVVNTPSAKQHFPGGLYREKPSVSLRVGDRLEQALADCGFIPISAVPDTPLLTFYSNASLHEPAAYESVGASINAKLSSMMQYILCVSRFAHYIKVMGRDKIGSYENAQSIESEFQRWLHQYTAASDESTEEVRAKFPLSEARIKVKEQLGKPGRFFSVVHLQPHFQLDQMVSSIRLITELTPKVHNG